MEQKILLTNIQRLSLHDGPGIRTTVFLKGCSLRCPWCSNPENISSQPQDYIKDGLLGIYGKYLTAEELVKECLKDKAFYDGKIPQESWSITDALQIDSLPGGVTFSGGEPLLQIQNLVPVCAKLQEERVHIAVETCLFVPKCSLSLALSYIDFFYVDMKIMDSNLCFSVEHGKLSLFLDNLNTLMGSGKPVVIRVPVIGSYTDTTQNRRAVHDLLEKYRPLKIELIKEHNLGEFKYKSLGMECSYQGVTDELMEIYTRELGDLVIPIEVCKI